jgi:hypothetical protein
LKKKTFLEWKLDDEMYNAIFLKHPVLPKLCKKAWSISSVIKPNCNGRFYGCGKFGVYSILDPFQA